MGQHFVETVNVQLHMTNGHWVFQYPDLHNAGGITSSLRAGFNKLIIPTNHKNLNWHFRIFSIATLLISGFSLFQTAIPRNPGLRTAVFLIITTSGQQFLEPSSEVIAATFLNLFLIALMRSWPTPLAAFFDLVWPGQGRKSSVAFQGAYSSFMRFHQFQSTIPTTDEATKATTETIFANAATLPEMVAKHPDLYFDFLGVSAARSIPNIIKVFEFMFVLMAAVAIQWKEVRENRFPLWAGLLPAATSYHLPSW